MTLIIGANWNYSDNRYIHYILWLRMVTADPAIRDKKNKMGHDGLIEVTQCAEQMQFL